MIINTILAKMKSLLDRLFQTEVECSPRCDESTREDINRLYREIKRSGPLFKQWSVRRVVQDVLYRQIPCWHANQGGDLSDAFTFYNYAKPGNAQWQQDQKLCRVNQELEDFLVEKDNSRVHGMEYSRTWAPRNWKRARSINECQYQRDLGDNDSSSLTAVDSSDDDRLSVEI
jgi:hypothetical protein